MFAALYLFERLKTLTSVCIQNSFARYGIGPEELKKLFRLDPRVEVFILFIGTTGTAAQRIEDSLPKGRAFSILDTATIPQILRQIFAFTMLRAKM